MKFLIKPALALLTVCIFVLCTVFLAANVSAAEVVDSGDCGENVTWVLYDDGELIISGEGEMVDFMYKASPWYSYISSITSVTIGNGVTSIGYFAFADCKTLMNITIGNNVVSIGAYALSYCENLAKVTVLSRDATFGRRVFSSAPVILYGYSCSTTEAYASAVGFTFVALDGPTFLLGDISGDGSVDIKDALRLFQYSMNQ